MSTRPMTLSSRLRTDRPRRPLGPHRPFWVGTTALAVVVVMVAALLMVRFAGFGYTVYRAEFAQAAQLRAGDYVSVAGVSVGEVKSIALAGEKVVVQLKVRSDVVMGENTRAAIKLTTLLGSRYVELRPSGVKPLADSTIPLSYTEIPYDLQALLADATPTFESIDTEQMARAIEVFARQLDGLPASLPQAMTNLRALSGIIAERRDQIGDLLRATATITTTLRRQQASLGQLVFQGRDLLAEFVSRREAFQGLMESVTRIVELLSKIVVNDGPAFEELLVNLRDLTALVSDHDDLFRNLLQVMPIPIRNVTNATGFSPALEFNARNGLIVDDWLCAISGRAQQFDLVEYFKDCK